VMKRCQREMVLGHLVAPKAHAVEKAEARAERLGKEWDAKRVERKASVKFIVCPNQAAERQ